MIRETKFYKYFAGSALSLALKNFLVYSVNFADNVMLGAYSETALSGAALCNQFQFLLQMLVVGAGEGVVVLGSQYWGKGTLEPIRHLIGVTLRFGAGMAAVMFGVVFFFPNQMLGLLTDDPAVISAGSQYLQIICFTYLIFTVTNILTASLQVIGIVSVGYLVSGTTLVMNVCLNQCLIYGNFGFPELGICGAAYATFVSRCLELLILIMFLKYKEHRLNLNWRNLLWIDGSYQKDYFKVAFPVLLNQAQWGIAQMIQTAVLGHLGSFVIAANSIAVMVFQVISVVAYGAASASGIVIGKTIGEGNMKELKQLAHTLEILFLGIGIVTGCLIFAVRGPVLSLYDISEKASALCSQFLCILAVTTVGTSYQMACDNGIIRGGGDTSFSMKMNLISMWGVVVPCAMLAAFVFRLSPVLVFFILKSDQIYKILPVKLHLKGWKWVKQVTREEAVT